MSAYKNNESIPSGWYAAGPDLLWEYDRPTTYAFVPAEVLPALPLGSLDGSFGWLRGLSPRSSALHYEDGDDGTALAADRLARLVAVSSERGLELPQPFLSFMTTPELFRRVSSVTGCYLDLSHNLLHPDLPSGPLLRFLTDSQECAAWYLQLRHEGSARVLASWHLEHDDDGELVPDFKRMHVVAQDFETFIYRFWLEDFIWQKLRAGEALSHEENVYCGTARQGAPSLRTAEDDL